MEQILLFLDIEGVLSVPGVELLEQLPHASAPSMYPVQGAKQLLQTIDRSSWIEPFWISSWGQESTVWNHWSDTRPWSWAYPLSLLQHFRAKRQFTTDEMDGKLLAARWHSRRSNNRVVWIEDGFSSAVKDWAAHDPKVQLIDTSAFFHSSKKRCQTGIRQWNIDLIRDALSIQETIEVSA